MIPLMKFNFLIIFYFDLHLQIIESISPKASIDKWSAQWAIFYVYCNRWKDGWDIYLIYINKVYIWHFFKTGLYCSTSFHIWVLSRLSSHYSKYHSVWPFSFYSLLLYYWFIIRYSKEGHLVGCSLLWFKYFSVHLFCNELQLNVTFPELKWQTLLAW